MEFRSEELPHSIGSTGDLRGIFSLLGFFILLFFFVAENLHNSKGLSALAHALFRLSPFFLSFLAVLFCPTSLFSVSPFFSVLSLFPYSPWRVLANTS